MKRIIAFFLILIILYGCKQIESSSSPNIVGLESISDVNKTISISLGVSNQNLEIGKHFNIVLVNNSSNDAITFPPDYNLHLFTYEENEWVELENRVEYPQASEITLIPFSKGGLENIVILPIFPDTTKDSVPLRVIVLGNIERNESKTVGAYIDLILNK